jgi:hypothetical protein
LNTTPATSKADKSIVAALVKIRLPGKDLRTPEIYGVGRVATIASLIYPSG